MGRCALWWALMLGGPEAWRGPGDPGVQGAGGDDQGLGTGGALVPAQAMACSHQRPGSFLPVCFSRWHQLWRTRSVLDTSHPAGRLCSSTPHPVSPLPSLGSIPLCSPYADLLGSPEVAILFLNEI